MAIDRLLRNSTFTPEEIIAVATAFEGARVDLRLNNPDDPRIELVAKKSFRKRNAVSSTRRSCGSKW